MVNRLQTIKKLTAALLVFSMVCSPITSTLSINRAYAGMAVSVVADAPVTMQTVGDGIRTVGQSIQTGLMTSLNLKEFTLDAIAWGIAKRIVSGMVRSLTNWVKSGFQGSPSFLTNFGDFMLEVGDQLFSDVISGSELSFLCSPFQLQVKGALTLSYGASRGRVNVPKCGINVVTQNINNFGKHVVAGGPIVGWQDWLQVVSNDGNNVYGSYFRTEGSLSLALVGAKNKEVKLLDFGKGFFSTKKCQQVLDQKSPTQIEVKQHCTVTTPGETIAEGINKALGLGQDTLVSADEINELIDALIGFALQQAITGIQGLAGYTPPKGSSNYSMGYSAQEPSQNYTQLERTYTSLLKTQKSALSMFEAVKSAIESKCTSQSKRRQLKTEESFIDSKIESLTALIREMEVASADAQAATSTGQATASLDQYQDFTSDPRAYLTLDTVTEYQGSVLSKVGQVCSGEDEDQQ